MKFNEPNFRRVLEYIEGNRSEWEQSQWPIANDATSCGCFLFHTGRMFRTPDADGIRRLLGLSEKQFSWIIRSRRTLADFHRFADDTAFRETRCRGNQFTARGTHHEIRTTDPDRACGECLGR